MEQNSNRNVYIAIIVAFGLLLAIIVILNRQQLNSDDLNATVDARVAAILTEEGFSGTQEGRIASALEIGQFDATSQA
jgi:hypothetical protein